MVCITSHGVVKLWNETKTLTLLVNAQRVKYYYYLDVECEEEAIKLANE